MFIVEDARGEVKRPSPDQLLGADGWLCTTAFFFLLQRVLDARAFVFDAGAFSSFWPFLPAAVEGSLFWHAAVTRGMSFVATESATMTEPLQL
jgi:hypothetical protein